MLLSMGADSFHLITAIRVDLSHIVSIVEAHSSAS